MLDDFLLDEGVRIKAFDLDHANSTFQRFVPDDEFIDTDIDDDKLGVLDRLVFVVIATDDKDANSQVAELLDTHGERVRWLVVRNRRGGDNLSLFAQSNARKRLTDLGAVEIDVPCLTEVTPNRLQDANLTVGRGRTGQRRRCICSIAHGGSAFTRGWRSNFQRHARSSSHEPPGTARPDKIAAGPAMAHPALSAATERRCFSSSPGTGTGSKRARIRHARTPCLRQPSRFIRERVLEGRGVGSESLGINAEPLPQAAPI